MFKKQNKVYNNYSKRIINNNYKSVNFEEMIIFEKMIILKALKNSKKDNLIKD